MGATSRVTRPLLVASAVAVAVVVTAVTGAAGLGRANADQEIVGGNRASIADHSYAVYLTTADGFQYCGGTLVDDNKVVTAAHCAAGKVPADVLVVAGREDKESDAGYTSQVREIWVHPDFRDVRTGADIAVLTLTNHLPYQTVDLPAKTDTESYQPGVLGLILGWGRTAADGQPSRFLLKAGVPIMSDADCTQAYSSYQAESMTCAGLPQGGVDSCQGDSGGPLIVGGKLVGITSWGESCAAAGKPGVYTRVASYVDVLDDEI